MKNPIKERKERKIQEETERRQKRFEEFEETNKIHNEIRKLELEMSRNRNQREYDVQQAILDIRDWLCKEKEQ